MKTHPAGTPYTALGGFELSTKAPQKHFLSGTGQDLQHLPGRHTAGPQDEAPAPSPLRPPTTGDPGRALPGRLRALHSRRRTG